MQEYYGGRGFYEDSVRPLLLKWDLAHAGKIRLTKYDDLYGFGWWAGTRRPHSGHSWPTLEDHMPR